ncbi:hypothetical protein EJ03DRAFT_346812 [Teratosphaeria nubilosa]|uniref:NAD(P)-binding protein n=1 Tax=Teratosphaeria nubilosa TaxID=161662 RepID=A0A6G1LP06_9PEZI|nr:hypothetical protein EJ03DRAFT_346812 [Teratosphaeria nubilosa]
MQQLELLILGAGWTSAFLIPLAHHHHLSLAATTQDGRPVANTPTQKWTFDPTTTNIPHQFAALPLAKNILITFPLTTAHQTHLLTTGYQTAHPGKNPRFIQLGSTGIWQIPQPIPTQPWVTRHSPHTTTSPRAEAEDALLARGGCVLNLSGLWGGTRDPRHWVERVAKTKEDVRAKTSLHMIHGLDVARAILAVVSSKDGGWEGHCKGQRWMLTDGFVYDWWALFAGWADREEVPGEVGGDVGRRPREQATWVYELMEEEGVRALPRSMEVLGRAYDGREFWRTFGLAPLKARI